MPEKKYYKITYEDGGHDYGIANDIDEFLDVIKEMTRENAEVEEITEDEFTEGKKKDADFVSKINYVMTNDEDQDEFSNPKKVKLTILIHALTSGVGFPSVDDLDAYYNWLTKE